MKELDQLRIGTAWVDVEVISEPFVVLTYRGYAPALAVRVIRNGLEKQLYIGAKSLAAALEGLRSKNEDRFSGLRLRIAKEDDTAMSPYKVEEIS